MHNHGPVFNFLSDKLDRGSRSVIDDMTVKHDSQTL